jgi:excinuclease ABC subunit C
MRLSVDKVEKLPDAPGVYFFIGALNQEGKSRKERNILYIGKATSLRNRVRSYFSSEILETRGPRIVKMLSKATDISFKKTDSVLEALILEASLIKKYQPKYNALEKDDKSFSFVVVTEEECPRVFSVRERELLFRKVNEYKKVFGPFTNGGQLKEALRILRKIFPFRGKNDAPLFNEKNKSRIYQEIGLAPDITKLGKKEYLRTIRHLILFFEGKKKNIQRQLENEMGKAIKVRNFEHASELKRRLLALKHINDVALLKSEVRNTKSKIRIEAYDVSHTMEANRVGVMVVVEDGEAKKREYRTFNIKTASSGDVSALKEVLERRLNHIEWQPPRIIVVDGGKAQKYATESVLREFGYSIPVVAVTKNKRHRPEQIMGNRELVTKHEHSILLANAEAHRFSLFHHRKKRSRS